MLVELCERVFFYYTSRQYYIHTHIYIYTQCGPDLLPLLTVCKIKKKTLGYFFFFSPPKPPDRPQLIIKTLFARLMLHSGRESPRASHAPYLSSAFSKKGEGGGGQGKRRMRNTAVANWATRLHLGVGFVGCIMNNFIAGLSIANDDMTYSGSVGASFRYPGSIEISQIYIWFFYISTGSKSSLGCAV